MTENHGPPHAARRRARSDHHGRVGRSRPQRPHRRRQPAPGQLGDLQLPDRRAGDMARRRHAERGLPAAHRTPSGRAVRLPLPATRPGPRTGSAGGCATSVTRSPAPSSTRTPPAPPRSRSCRSSPAASPPVGRGPPGLKGNGSSVSPCPTWSTYAPVTRWKTHGRSPSRSLCGRARNWPRCSATTTGGSTPTPAPGTDRQRHEQPGPDKRAVPLGCRPLSVPVSEPWISRSRAAGPE